MKYLSEILPDIIKKFPSRVAVVEVEGAQMTYRELWNKTKLISGIFQELRLGITHRIGLLAPKKLETVAGLFGIIQTRSAYVPTDAEAPVSRNINIIEDCQLHALLIHTSLLDDYAVFLQKHYRRISTPELKELVLFQRKNYSDLVATEESDLAFILYTSGSTGKPKGVMITHQNALSFVLWANEVFTLSEHDVFASIAPFHFDLSVFDLFVTFRNGARLQLIDSKTSRNPRLIASLIDERKISVWYSTPTLLKLMLNFGKLDRYKHDSLRYVLFAGEVFPVAQLQQLMTKWHHVELYNLYGPTETNVCTFYKIPEKVKSPSRPIPIGKACSFAKIKIIRDQDKRKKNDEGELWVSGLSVSPGYWQQPDKSANSFLTDVDGDRWYKTGDWVRRDEAGQIRFLGRKDRMVKRRGYRIELPEIEAAIYRHPYVISAAVFAKEEADEVKIYAYYQQKLESSKKLELLELQEHCLQFIPKYMLPDVFNEIDKMPQTSTQKIDYQELSKKLHST